MKQITIAPWVVAVAVLASATAHGAPLTPQIVSDLFQFDVSMIYSTNGVAPDRLISATDPPGTGGGDVTIYRPNWPAVNPALPLYFVQGGGPLVFGADMLLDVVLNASDAVGGGFPNISLTGTGGRPGDDVVITGATSPGAASNETLWTMDLTQVSFYGNAGQNSFLVEGIGTITGGTMATGKALVGKTGVIRGNFDITSIPPGLLNPFIQAGYSPTDNIASVALAALSGQFGVGVLIPEPSTLALCLIGLTGVFVARSRVVRRRTTRPG
ncbi:MAG: PEP-CTERM sorting domain-containing protein [Pirellulales bacterium]